MEGRALRRALFLFEYLNDVYYKSQIISSIYQNYYESEQAIDF